jgi:hypothetical protein
MKVTLKLVRRANQSTIYIKEEVHKGIGLILYHGDWLILIPLDSRIQQISYRKELVFAVIEEKEDGDE